MESNWYDSALDTLTNVGSQMATEALGNFFGINNDKENQKSQTQPQPQTTHVTVAAADNKMLYYIIGGGVLLMGALFFMTKR